MHIECKHVSLPVYDIHQTLARYAAYGGRQYQALRIGAEFGPFARAQVDEDHRHFRVAFVVGRGVVSAHDVAVGRDGRRMEVVELTVYYRQGSVAQLCDLDACRGLTVTSVLLSAPVRFSSGVRTSAVPCRSACSQLPDERASQLSGEVITSIVKGVLSVWRKVQAASLSRT